MQTTSCSQNALLLSGVCKNKGPFFGLTFLKGGQRGTQRPRGALFRIYPFGLHAISIGITLFPTTNTFQGPFQDCLPKPSDCQPPCLERGRRVLFSVLGLAVCVCVPPVASLATEGKPETPSRSQAMGPAMVSAGPLCCGGVPFPGPFGGV